jgi:hypothetical protein
MHKNNYSLEVLVKGKPVQEFIHESKSFIEARENTEYTLRFRNNSWKKVMAIFSVDGVEVLKGKVAANAENGYIVQPFSSIEVKGYRIDDKTVAAFKFSRGPQSYAVVVGGETNEPEGDPALGVFKHDKTDRNNGVIGVRVFEEDVAEKDYAAAYKQLPVATYTTSSSGGGLTWSGTGSNGIFTSGCSPSSFTVNVTGSAGMFSVSNGGTYASSGPRARTIYQCNSTFTGPAFANGGEVTTSRTDINQFGKLDRVEDLICEGPIYGATISSSVSIYNLSCTGVHTTYGVSNPAAAAPAFDMGSSWGGKVEDKIREVQFKRVDSFTEIVLFYASKPSLISWGIDFSNTKEVFAWPSAFEDRKQYCKAPPGWTGQGKGGGK